jgi:hypothetical protein
MKVLLFENGENGENGGDGGTAPCGVRSRCVGSGPGQEQASFHNSHIIIIMLFHAVVRSMQGPACPGAANGIAL